VLGEPVRAPLVLGALAIVAGGALLAGERDRPAHLRARGLAFALVASILFAIRDNIVRGFHAHATPETIAVASMLAGLLVALAATRSVPTRREIRALAPAGVLFAFSYIFLFEAFARGRVSVVSPLVATESLWGVALAAAVFTHSEQVGRRVVLGAVAIVAGGILIGVSAGS
jgi:drug/metabolite transporter (DMT)-like permease